MDSILPELLEDLAYWIREREQIARLKDWGAPKPWTLDPILQSYRFCNVRREDDKVTKWFANNWRSQQYWVEPNFVPAIMLGRTINWPGTLEYIGFPHVWDRNFFWRKLDEFQAQGNKVYTGAYMITAGPTGVSKNEWVTGNADKYFNDPPKLWNTLEESWKALQQYPCVGPFIAGQIIADLKHTPVLRSAPDWKTWAAIGPGSARGLNRLYGRNFKVPVTQERGLLEMREAYNALGRFDLCMQDFQNCLCEFDKYERVKWGQGKPRSGYPGTR